MCMNYPVVNIYTLSFFFSVWRKDPFCLSGNTRPFSMLFMVDKSALRGIFYKKCETSDLMCK